MKWKWKYAKEEKHTENIKHQENKSEIKKNQWFEKRTRKMEIKEMKIWTKMINEFQSIKRK
jgi:hypothetical protein